MNLLVEKVVEKVERRNHESISSFNHMPLKFVKRQLLSCNCPLARWRLIRSPALSLKLRIESLYVITLHLSLPLLYYNLNYGENLHLGFQVDNFFTPVKEKK